MHEKWIEIEPTLAVMRNKRIKLPKTKTLTAKLKSLLKLGQSNRNARKKNYLEAKIGKTLWRTRRKVQKMKYGRLLKFSTPMNWSIAWWITSTIFDFPFLCIFSFLDPSFVFFSWIPQFSCLMPRECLFLFKNWPFYKNMSIWCSIWCIWHEIHVIKRHRHQAIISKNLIIKKFKCYVKKLSPNINKLFFN